MVLIATTRLFSSLEWSQVYPEPVSDDVPSVSVPNDQGKTFSEYSKTKNYNSVVDPTMKPIVGMELPGSVTLYPLPDIMKVQSADKYRYSIINDHPVVVESTTRKVVHSWE